MIGLLRAALLAAGLASAWSAHAKESDGSEIAVRVDIPSLSTVEALNEFALQTGLQLIVPQDVSAGQLDKRIPRIKVAGTVREVLGAMLTGTSLRYTFVNERTISVYELKEPKVVKVEDLNVHEVVITGSRIPYDLRADGRPDTTAPTTIFDRAQIDALGVSDITGLLKSLPQQPYGPRATFSAPGSAGLAEMRGLGFDTTQILVNGRRIAGSASLISWGAFDLNTLPLSIVDRVEVLSDSSSAVYGTDAIGGVINIVLKRQIPHPVIDLYYGSATGGADERRVSISAGHSSDRFHASFAGDYFSRNLLLGSERRWADQDYRRFGGHDERSTSAYPGNISSLTGENLPGLTSSTAAAPPGRTGILTRDDFVATAGTQNRVSPYRYWAAIPASDRGGMTAFADFDVTPALNVFGEFQYTAVTTRAQYEPAVRQLIAPANNPFNPFGEPVAVEYMFSDLGPRRSVRESQFERSVVGLRGNMREWDWEFSLLRNRDVSILTDKNALDDMAVSAALASTDPTQALNLFHDGLAASPDVLASLSAERTSSDNSSALWQVSAVARGRVGRLSAGDIDAVIGTEVTRTDVRMLERFASVDSYRAVNAVFGKLRLPLVNGAMQVRAVHELALTVAARADRYKDGFGTSFNPQYGVLWRPVDELMLRASVGTSFHAPSLFELYTPRTAIPNIPLPDPSRNGALSSVTFVTGGNPRLQPVEAKSLAAGFVVTPLSDIQVSASYWRVHMENRVSIIPFNVLIDNEASFPSRIGRMERTAADIAAGQPGALTYLDISRINFGSLETDGIDLGAKYSISSDFGKISLNLAATWVNSYRAINIPGTLSIDRVATADTAGSIARWRGVATVARATAATNLSLSTHYTSGYADADVMTVKPLQRRLAGQHEIDMQGSINLEALLGHRLSGTVVTVGVSNLMDKEPAFALVGGLIGFDPTQGDLRGRFTYARVSKSF